MFSKPKEFPALLKELEEYELEKGLSTASNKLDTQKYILSKWLNEKLKSANGDVNIFLIALISAHEMNIQIEKQSSHAKNIIPSLSSIYEIFEQIKKSCDDRYKELEKHDDIEYKSLEVTKTGLVTKSDLSRIIVALFQDIQKKIKPMSVKKDSRSHDL